jgi:catechol 2,3-dioxygenase-like lactoylglutathione lyase family enzyme
MKVPFTLGEVGHFGLAVRDPQKSAKWFQRALGLRKEFDYENGVAVGNDNVTIALFKGKSSPETIDHMSFHLPNMATLRKALEHVKSVDADIEDPGDEIGPEAEENGLRCRLLLGQLPATLALDEHRSLLLS